MIKLNDTSFSDNVKIVLNNIAYEWISETIRDREEDSDDVMNRIQCDAVIKFIRMYILCEEKK